MNVHPFPHFQEIAHHHRSRLTVTNLWCPIPQFVSSCFLARARAIRRLERLYSMARFLAAVLWVNAAAPPNGPERDISICIVRRDEMELTSGCLVLHLDNADVGSRSNGTGAGHASWHLDLDWEVSGSGGRDTSHETWDILGDLGLLESSWVSSSRCCVNHGGEWSGTILVDLVEGHADFTGVAGGWETI